MPVYLLGLATAVPPYELPQDLALDTARSVLGPKYSQFERMANTFKTSGVETRYSTVPVDWFQESKAWPERNERYLKGSKELFIEAARKALKGADLSADQIDTVVTVSSTGIATPTIEALAFEEMGFRTDIHRVPVFGLGCAGGVSGLSIARAMSAAKPNSNVLMVAIETCTLSFRSDRLQKADIIATVLFGDGAAAAILSSKPSKASTKRIELHEGQEEMWVDTLDIMGWDIDETGLGVVFDRCNPAFAEEHFAAATEKALERSSIKMTELDRFICHPGGAKVIKALETSLSLPPETLDMERSVLKDYGNMSAPTALFVLDRALNDGRSGKMLMCALGPGFTASYLPLTVSNHV